MAWVRFAFVVVSGAVCAARTFGADAPPLVETEAELPDGALALRNLRWNPPSYFVRGGVPEQQPRETPGTEMYWLQFRADLPDGLRLLPPDGGERFSSRVGVALGPDEPPPVMPQHPIFRPSGADSALMLNLRLPSTTTRVEAFTGVLRGVRALRTETVVVPLDAAGRVAAGREDALPTMTLAWSGGGVAGMQATPLRPPEAWRTEENLSGFLSSLVEAYAVRGGRERRAMFRVHRLADQYVFSLSEPGAPPSEPPEAYRLVVNVAPEIVSFPLDAPGVALPSAWLPPADAPYGPRGPLETAADGWRARLWWLEDGRFTLTGASLAKRWTLMATLAPEAPGAEGGALLLRTARAARLTTDTGAVYADVKPERLTALETALALSVGGETANAVAMLALPAEPPAPAPERAAELSWTAAFLRVEAWAEAEAALTWEKGRATAAGGRGMRYSPWPATPYRSSG